MSFLYIINDYQWIINFDNTNMDKDRDFNRQNKAYTVVNGTIYNMLTHDCIQGINTIVKSVNQPEDETNICAGCATNKRKFKDIATLAQTGIKTNKESCHKLLKCSTYIKTGAYELAMSEHNLMLTAFNNGEAK